MTTRYLVDDLNPTGYAQVVEEVVSGAGQRTYSYGIQRINQNQLINSAWTPSFYGYDGLGGVRTLADSTGAVTDTYDYDAWGNTVNTTGSTPNLYLYRGEQYDPDLLLYYLRARYFNPLSGRFLTRDAAAGRTRVPATLHKYLYAGADPVNRLDPGGHDYFFYQVWVQKTIAVTTVVALVGSAVYEAWECTNEALEAARRRSGNSSGPGIGEGSPKYKGACELFHIDPAEPPEVPPLGPPRVPTPPLY